MENSESILMNNNQSFCTIDNEKRKKNTNWGRNENQGFNEKGKKKGCDFYGENFNLTSQSSILFTHFPLCNCATNNDRVFPYL